MKVFGLTGGIGMGKTTAGNLLGERAVPVIDTDVLAREIVEPGRPALQEIQRAFGNQVIGPDGQLRREELARIVFSDTAARQKLENITHPRIRELWQAQIEKSGGGKHRRPRSSLFPCCSKPAPRASWTRRSARPGPPPPSVAGSPNAAGPRSKSPSVWPLNGRSKKKMARADYIALSEDGLEILAEQLDRIFFGKSSGRATAHDHQGA